jgi:hypothetical protein
MNICSLLYPNVIILKHWMKKLECSFLAILIG